jgi:large conductance mechanosensitive channel
MLKEFKEFAFKGNMVDLAVGVIIGGAFGKVITSIVNDLIMPPIGLLLGKVNFNDLFISFNGKHYSTLAQAKADPAGAAPTLNYGQFLSTFLDFLIVAFVIFLVIRQLAKFRKKGEPEAKDPVSKDCPFCLSEIPIKATRCKFCTSQLEDGKVAASTT